MRCCTRRARCSIVHARDMFIRQHTASNSYYYRSVPPLSLADASRLSERFWEAMCHECMRLLDWIRHIYPRQGVRMHAPARSRSRTALRVSTSGWWTVGWHVHHDTGGPRQGGGFRPLRRTNPRVFAQTPNKPFRIRGATVQSVTPTFGV